MTLRSLCSTRGVLSIPLWRRLAFPVASEDRRALAMEELMIAEGSDWNWCTGRAPFRQSRGVRSDLPRASANVYRSLGLQTPPELSQSILRMEAHDTYSLPTGRIKPVVDGVGSYFEWMGAGVYGWMGATSHARQTDAHQGSAV